MAATTRSLGWILASLALGIILASSVPAPTAVGGTFAVLGLGSLLGWPPARKKALLAAAALLFAASLGALRVATLEPVRSPHADLLLGERATLSGIIVREPDRRSASTHYVMRIDAAEGALLPRPFLATVYADRYPEHGIGDAVILEGALELPEDFSSEPDRPAFPYVAYLAKDGIGYLVKYPDIRSATSTSAYPIQSALFFLKRKITEIGWRIFPEPEGGLIAGILLGEKRALPDRILDEMRVAGLIHIIVVSGYNMTVVAEGVGRIFGRLPVRARSAIGVLFIWIYAGIVGGGAPVIRASIMTSLALLARMTGNASFALRALFLAVATMIALNPRIVLSDPSFHLSLLATLGLIVLAPAIAARLPRRTPARGKDLLASTLAAQAFVFPYILFFSGQVSPYALPANFLALPMVPIAMALSAGAILLGAVIPVLGPLFGGIAAIPAWWILLSGEFFAALPKSAVAFPIPWWGSLLLYAAGWILYRRFFRGKAVDVPIEDVHHDAGNARDRGAVPAENMKALSEGIAQK